jgi:hypothetical protein
MEHRLMTEHEKADIFMKSYELKQSGKEEEAIAMRRTIPLPAHLAQFAKKYMGSEFLIQSGWNLAEAEAKFGTDWLNK